MVRNYLKTAFRNLKKRKLFSIINTAGLSIGLASCMLILLYIKDEWSFDRFHKKSERIYQLVCDRVEKDGATERFAIAAMAQAPAFKRAIPEIEGFVRINAKQLIIKKAEIAFSESVTWVDSNFFSIFSFPLISGDAKTALAESHSLVLTDVVAKKYFGTENAMGKSLQLEINGQFEIFRVSAIARTAPQNSTIKFDVLLPFNFLEEASPDNGWMWVSYPTYFLLHPGANISNIKSKMQKVYQIQAKSEIDMNHQAGYDNQFIWDIMPMTQMHLNTDYKGTPWSSNPIYSYILSGVAIFILLIACINFINLTIAQSLRRNKEIGMRKVFGAHRKQLMFQFLGESLLECFFSFLCALLLLQLLLPVFNQLTDKKLSLKYLFDIQLLMTFIALFISTGIAAGFYPALVLSRLSPMQTLHDGNKLQGKDYFAKGLVIIQFSLAIFFITSVSFMYMQFNFLVKKDLGYVDKNLIEFVAEKAIMNKPLMDVFKTEMLSVAGVESVGYRNIGKFGGKTHAGGREFAAVYERVDEDYLNTLAATIIEGRNFSRSFPTDSSDAVLINETFAKQADWKNAIGRSVDFMNIPGWGEKKMIVVGVVKDYHFESLKEKIKPQIFTMDPHLPVGLFEVRINSNNIPATMSGLEKKFHALMPDHPFEYSFKDVQNRKNYEKEEKWKQIIKIGALLAILISCIGLFGLAMVNTEKRFKEIAVRKVLGASTFRITQMICFEFVKLVLISFFIAVPPCWYAIHKWLQNFAYRIDISWWGFLASGLLAMIIALITVGFLAIKASMATPVQSLRTN